MEWSIAEKSLHIICVSLSNKRVHGIMPRSLKKYHSIFYNDAYLTDGTWLPDISHSDQQNQQRIEYSKQNKMVDPVGKSHTIALRQPFPPVSPRPNAEDLTFSTINAITSATD